MRSADTGLLPAMGRRVRGMVNDGGQAGQGRARQGMAGKGAGEQNGMYCLLCLEEENDDDNRTSSLLLAYDRS